MADLGHKYLTAELQVDFNKCRGQSYDHAVNMAGRQWRSYLLANVAKTKGGRLVGAAKCDDFFVLSEQEQVWRIDWCL